MIEMLTVLALMATVMTISVRAVGDTLRRDRATKVSAIVGTDIEQAFATAARLREPVRMVLDRTNKRLTIQDRQATPTVYKTRSFALAGEYGLDSLASNRDTVDIMPNGIATGDWRLSLMIKTNGGDVYSKSVRVSRGGLVRVNNR